MAGFEGWWVNGLTGKGHHVAEHWMEVKGDPEKYGLTEPEVERIVQKAGGKFMPGDTSPDGARGMLLKAAMRNGWVRVRGYQAKYSIQAFGHLATYLPKVMKFLKGAGVGPYSEMMVTDLASDFTQRYMEGMADIHRALKQGRIPDLAPPEERITLKRQSLAKPGIPVGVDDKQARTLMRQQLGQKHHVPDPDPGDDKIEENKGKGFAKGMHRIFG